MISIRRFVVMYRTKPALAYTTWRFHVPEVGPVFSAKGTIRISRINLTHTTTPLGIKNGGVFSAPPGEFLRRPAPFRHASQRTSLSNCLAVALKDTGCRNLAIDEPIAHRVMWQPVKGGLKADRDGRQGKNRSGKRPYHPQVPYIAS